MRKYGNYIVQAIFNDGTTEEKSTDNYKEMIQFYNNFKEDYGTSATSVISKGVNVYGIWEVIYKKEYNNPTQVITNKNNEEDLIGQLNDIINKILYKKEVLENNIKIITKERDCNYHEIEALDIITEGMSEQEKITYKLNLINKIELQCKKRRQYKNEYRAIRSLNDSISLDKLIRSVNKATKLENSTPTREEILNNDKTKIYEFTYKNDNERYNKMIELNKKFDKVIDTGYGTLKCYNVIYSCNKKKNSNNNKIYDCKSKIPKDIGSSIKFKLFGSAKDLNNQYTRGLIEKYESYEIVGNVLKLNNRLKK